VPVFIILVSNYVKNVIRLTLNALIIIGIGGVILLASKAYTVLGFTPGISTEHKKSKLSIFYIFMFPITGKHTF